VYLREALQLLHKFKAEAVGFKNGRGTVGALAAVGETLDGDHTYEAIAYRVPENCGSKRKVDEASIFEMDKATEPHTFNNVDTEKRRVIITPRGPDPILLGVRGESPEIVKKAFGMVKTFEPVERWVIFRTNQGTDAHLKRVASLNQIEPHSPVLARGTVSANPRIVPLRHVVFSVKDATAEADCAAYEPTGELRRIARELVVGDEIEVSGGVRPASRNRPLTINLEKMRVLKRATRIAYTNPVCVHCGKRLKSMGRNQGFRCEKCGSRYPTLEKVKAEVKRAIRAGLYITSVRSQRHLTKPFRRYGQEKRHANFELIDGWHSL
jgi:tRNA(Ile2)-agmatinylcytidine synthase